MEAKSHHIKSSIAKLEENEIAKIRKMSKKNPEKLRPSQK